MRLILNGINGQYLRYITDNCAGQTEFVEAAVAYASDDRILFNWCWENNIPLRYWGRIDEKIPVNVQLLRQFLARKSPSFVCKLVSHFHAKVIWWHGVGVYIGSANLSDPAWYGNIEAGCYYEEGEIADTPMEMQLKEFFRCVDEHAAPLTDELFKEIENRAKEIELLSAQDRERAKKFMQSTGLRQWNGLLRQSANSARDRHKEAFLREWFSTLQILRDIGARVADDSMRPIWIPKNTPTGAQADQFLHAYYYSHVFDDARRSIFEEEYERNSPDPEGALKNAIAWWHGRDEPPSNEDRTLLDWAPFLRETLSPERLQTLSFAEFSEVCERVWSIQDHARRVSNVTVNLPGNRRYEMSEKTRALAGFLYARKAKNGANVLEVINYVLYDGREDDLPIRLWDAVSDENWRIEHLGISALGELVGWALPHKFPPRNNRTSKALRSLGNNVEVHG
jgi:hypothetical protein